MKLIFVINRNIMRQTFETLIHNYINNSKFEYSYSQDDPSHLKYGLISVIIYLIFNNFYIEILSKR